MAVVQMSAIPRFHATRKGASAAVLTHDGHTVSWGELEARANRRARLFAASGMKADDFVTIALPNAAFRGVKDGTATVRSRVCTN